MRLSKFFAATGLAVMALSGVRASAQEAAAAAPAGSEAGGLDEIVVTAEKRRENLQDTAISISVLNAEGLEDRHVASLVDLGDGAIPSLKVAPFFSRPGALIMNVRGIGVLADSNQPARDQGVGVYIDGVYLGRPQGLGMALYDIENIEVLKGPQGTLFGRNTAGGAVNVVTKRPSGEFALRTAAGVGNFGSYHSDLHLDLPEYAHVSFKLDGVITSREGWVQNPLASADDFGGYDKRGVHAEFLWRPSEHLSADYAFDSSYDATTTLYQQFLAPPSVTPFVNPALRIAAVNTLQPGRATRATFGVPEQPSVGNTDGHRLTVEWEPADGVTVKSITSYRNLSQTQYDNGSAAQSNGVFTTGSTFLNATFGRYSLARFDQDQFSQEIQLIGETDRLKYAAGAIYYREHVQDNAQAFATNQFTDSIGLANNILSLNYAAQRIDRASKVETTSEGLFAQGTYTPPVLNDALHLTLGGRYTYDKKEGRLLTVNGALPNVNGVIGPRGLSAHWDRFDPLVTVGYDVSDDILVYGKYSTGYRSGGANSRSLFYSPFNPETVEMFEIGAKTEFWDNRARLNLAAYTGTYKDIQLDFSAQYLQFDPLTGAVLSSTLRTTTETTNAPGNGDLNGFEADLTVAATDRLTLSASYAYNKVDIPATVNPFRQSDGSFITQPIPIYQVYTPENSASAAIDYEMPFMEANLVAHLDANYDEGYYANYTDSLFDPTTRAVLIPQPKGDSGFIVNGRLALTDIRAGGGLFTVALWSRNLLDEEHVFLKFQGQNSGVAGFYNEPRTFGVDVSLKM